VAFRNGALLTRAGLRNSETPKQPDIVRARIALVETRIFIGTAGCSIPAQYGSDFPDGASHLERYAKQFGAVEINSSFYRPHRQSTYVRWAQTVPDGFRFSVKLPKSITHEARIQGAADLIAAFAEQIGGLGRKLGVVLVQLPPSLDFDVVKAGQFLGALQAAIGCPIVIEPRHASWSSPSATALMKERHVARVMADPVVIPAGEAPAGWPGLRYRRLHGSPRIYHSSYDSEFLAKLGSTLARERREGIETWCIFDNTASFQATANALELERSLA
jgi:uncharacterized protein YecE (DUF72 family)